MQENLHSHDELCLVSSGVDVHFDFGEKLQRAETIQFALCLSWQSEVTRNIVSEGTLSDSDTKALIGPNDDEVK